MRDPHQTGADSAFKDTVAFDIIDRSEVTSGSLAKLYCGQLGKSQYYYDDDVGAVCGDGSSEYVPGTGGDICFRWTWGCDSTEAVRTWTPRIGYASGVAADFCGIAGANQCSVSTQVIEIAFDIYAVDAECDRPVAINAKACQGNLDSLTFDVATAWTSAVPGSGGSLLSGLVLPVDGIATPWVSTTAATPGCNLWKNAFDVIVLGRSGC